MSHPRGKQPADIIAIRSNVGRVEDALFPMIWNIKKSGEMRVSHVVIVDDIVRRDCTLTRHEQKLVDISSFARPRLLDLAEATAAFGI